MLPSAGGVGCVALAGVVFGEIGEGLMFAETGELPVSVAVS